MNLDSITLDDGIGFGLRLGLRQELKNKVSAPVRLVVDTNAYDIVPVGCYIVMTIAHFTRDFVYERY